MPRFGGLRGLKGIIYNSDLGIILESQMEKHSTFLIPGTSKPVLVSAHGNSAFAKYHKANNLPMPKIYKAEAGYQYYETPKPKIIKVKAPKVVDVPKTKSEVPAISFSLVKKETRPEAIFAEALYKVLFTTRPEEEQEEILTSLENNQQQGNSVFLPDTKKAFLEYLDLYDNIRDHKVRYQTALDKLIAIMRDDIMYQLTFTNHLGEETYSTLTKKNLKQRNLGAKILHGILDNFVSSLDIHEEGYEGEIIEQKIYNFMNHLSNISLKKIDPNYYTNRGQVLTAKGELFPYLNTSEHDLLNYQIISDPNQVGVCKEHCLVYAIKTYYIKNLKEVYDIIRAGPFPKRQLGQIAKAIKHTIRLNYFKGNGLVKTSVYTDKQEHPEISIALYKDHYFRFDKFNKGFTLPTLKGVGTHKMPNSLVLVKTLFEEGKFIEHNCFLDVVRFGNNSDDDTLDVTNQAPMKIAKKKRSCYKCSSKTSKLCPCCFEAFELLCGQKKTKKPLTKTEKALLLDRFRRPTLYIFADTEAVTATHDRAHIPFRHGFVCDGEDEVTISETIELHFNRICLKAEEAECKDVVVYYHNLKYDWSLLKTNTVINILDICEKDGGVYSVTLKCLTHRKINIELRDSYKIINKPLSAFASTFNLTASKKELIIYDLYTQANINASTVTIEPFEGTADQVFDIVKGTLTKHIGTLKLTDLQNYVLLDSRIAVHKSFLALADDQIPDVKLITEPRKGFRGRLFPGTYSHMKHMDYYLKYDCLTLKEGINAFFKQLDDTLEIDCRSSLTISSIAHKWAIQKGAYTGVYSINGTTRSFVTKCMAGGRVSCAYNRRHIAYGRIEDFDGVSLYPSAIARICGFAPHPKTYEADNVMFGFPMGEYIDYRDEQDFKEQPNIYYFVEVVALEDTKEQAIAFPRVRKTVTKDVPSKKRPGKTVKMTTEKVIYTNKVRGETLYLGKWALEDLVKFCGLKYKFVKGIYWPMCNGANTNLGECVQELFDLRLKAKADKNKVKDEAFKLALNSLYGKNMLGRSKTKTSCVVKEKHVETFIQTHYNEIRSYQVLGNTTVFKMENESIRDANNIHIACMILDMSRRIMNEVIDTADNVGIEMLYSDTDSIHLINNNNDLDRLAESYKQKYYRDLVGSNLGQFHSDFNFPGHRDIYAVATYIVDKKVYYDKIRGINLQTGEEEFTNHIRFKGMNKHGLKEQIIKYGSEEELYKALISGEHIKFNLCYGDGISFDTSGLAPITRTDFYREAHFKGVEVITHKPKKIRTSI